MDTLGSRCLYEMRNLRKPSDPLLFWVDPNSVEIWDQRRLNGYIIHYTLHTHRAEPGVKISTVAFAEVLSIISEEGGVHVNLGVSGEPLTPGMQSYNRGAYLKVRESPNSL